MYPITLDLNHTRIALVGNGKATVRRLAQLDEDGARHITVFATHPTPALAKAARSRLRTRLPEADELQATHILMIVDLEEETAATLAEHARRLGTLVNVEDRREHCDFHFTSFIKRGDLLLTVSTNGTSPTLGKHIREELEARFDETWAQRLEAIAAQRTQWQREGLSMQEIAQRSHAYIEEKSWFSPFDKRHPDASQDLISQPPKILSQAQDDVPDEENTA